MIIWIVGIRFLVILIMNKLLISDRLELVLLFKKVLTVIIADISCNVVGYLFRHLNFGKHHRITWIVLRA